MSEKTDVTRRRFVQFGSGVALLGLGGGLAASSGSGQEGDGTPGNETTTNESSGTEMTSDGGESESGTDETGRVRVAHLSPDAPNVDVFVDGDAVLEDVPFKAVSDYLELPTGRYEVQVAPAGEGADAAVLTATLDVPAADVTVAAIGEVAGENQPLQLSILEDDNSDPGEGTARVRAVHASPDAPAVDVVVAETDEAVFEGVEFGQAAYAEVPAGAFRLCIYPAGSREDAVLGADVDLSGGMVASAFAAGYVAPDEAPADQPFDIVLTVDAE